MKTIVQIVPLRIKRVISHCLCNNVTGSLLAKWFDDQIPYHDFYFNTSRNSIPAFVKALIFWGIYESAESRLICKYIDSDIDVVELGGGIGITSSFIGKQLHSGRKLVIVEANSDLIPLLQQNLETNAGHIETTIVQAAVGPYDDLTSEITYFTCSSRYTVSRLYDGKLREDERTEVVDSISLKRLLEENSIGSFQLVADIEGAEALLFDHQKKAFDRCTKIVIELHETIVNGERRSIQSIRESIESLGFRLLDQDGCVFAFSR